MRFLTPKDFGALIREARISAGMTQAELGERVGASRYWVAEFERGNGGAELGRTLKALRALKLVLTIEPKETVTRREQGGQQSPNDKVTLNQPAFDLSSILTKSLTPIMWGQRSDPFRVDSWRTPPQPANEHTRDVREPRASRKRKRR